jgi:hypothetical protein
MRARGHSTFGRAQSQAHPVRPAQTLYFKPNSTLYPLKSYHNKRWDSSATTHATTAPTTATANSSALAWHLLVDNSIDRDQDSDDDHTSATQAPPKPLPDPPLTSSIADIIPYLTKLVFGERQLLWRIGLSITLMFMSKAAGTAGRMGYNILRPSSMRRHADSTSPCTH